MFIISFILSILISFGYVTMQFSKLREIISLSNTILFDGGSLNTVLLYNQTLIPPKYIVNFTTTCTGVWDCANKMCDIFTQKSHYKISYIAIRPNIPNNFDLQCTDKIWNWVEKSSQYMVSYGLVLLSFLCVILANFMIVGILIHNCCNPEYDNELITLNNIQEIKPAKKYRRVVLYIIIGILRLPAIVSMIVFRTYTYPYLVLDTAPSDVTLFLIINDVIFSLIYLIDYVNITHHTSKISIITSS